MEKGDISNEVAPKLVFVFDGLVGRIPEEDEKLAEKYRKRRKWEMLARIYEVDTQMGAHLWDVVWRSRFSFDLVSFESADEAWHEALERLLSRANVPYSRLEVYDDPNDFAQHMVYAPNILRVYHGRSDWWAKFGNKGDLITDAAVFKIR